MADEIDTRVTPSFHPETVQAIAEYDDDTSSILAGTVSAFTEAYIAVGRVHDASAASKTNPAWNEAAALIHTADFADKLTLQLAMTARWHWNCSDTWGCCNESWHFAGGAPPH